MGHLKSSLLIWMLVLVIVSESDRCIVAEARPLSLSSQQQRDNSNAFASLGMVCKCCDGIEGECLSTWTESCSKLQCLPWKQHSQGSS